MLSRSESLSNDVLVSVLAQSKDATAIYHSENMHISFVNDAMLALWGKDKTIVGKTFEEAIPEIVGQSFTGLLQNVWRTGETYTAKDTPADLVINGVLTTSYFDFEYRAIKDGNGLVYCLLHTATDVTERLKAWRLVQEKEAIEQNLNEELTTANEELTSINEEYQAANEELLVINEELQSLQLERNNLHQAVAESEERFRFALNAAQIGTWNLDVKNSLVSWDERCKQLYGFSKDDIVPYDQVLKYMHPDDVNNVHEAVQYALNPESAGHYDIQFRTIGADDGQVRWLQATGKASFEANGMPYRFSGTVQDITFDKQQAEALAQVHQNLLQQEEQLRLTISAANLGIWNLKVATGELVLNERCRELYGLTLKDNLTMADLIATLSAEYADTAQFTLQQAIDNDMPCDVLYQIYTADYQEMRWLRSVGRTYINNDDSKWFYGVVLDVTDQKLAEQHKDDFISIASHELKTPITSLTASLQLLDKLRAKPDHPMVPKLIMQSRRSVDRVGTLINDLLSVGRLQQKQMSLNKSTFILSQLLNACANPVSIANKQTINITGELDLYIHADEDRIDQVVTNFLNNAIKYAPNAGAIDLAITKNDAFVKVAVRDYGPGIDADKLKHLFDRYYRVDKTIQHVSGLGLGLYICKEIVERHNGHIGVNSTLGKGSEFWFELPLNAQ